MCDHCKAILDDGNIILAPHLSINFNRQSGWVRPRGSVWKHDKEHGNGGIRQFCNGVCLGRYFTAQKPKNQRGKNK